MSTYFQLSKNSLDIGTRFMEHYWDCKLQKLVKNRKKCKLNRRNDKTKTSVPIFHMVKEKIQKVGDGGAEFRQPIWTPK